MLTPEQETARAVKASRLYGKPLPSELKKQAAPPFNWRLASLNSGLILLPALFTVGVFRFYLNANFGNVSDLQAASILLIIELLAALAILLLVLRYVRRMLTDHFLGVRVSFWLVSAGVIGIMYGAVRLTGVHEGEGIGELAAHVAYFALLFLPLAFLWSLGVIYACDRRARR